MRSATIASVLAALAVAAVSNSCGGDPERPEAQIRRVLGAMEEAVERGDVSAFKEHISERYADDYGNDRRELMATVTFHVMRNGRRHAWLRIRQVDVREPSRAEVSLAAGLAGRPVRGPEDLAGLRADVYAVDLDLEREGQDWRVVWARWRRAPATDLL